MELIKKDGPVERIYDVKRVPHPYCEWSYFNVKEHILDQVISFPWVAVLKRWGQLVQMRPLGDEKYKSVLY